MALLPSWHFYAIGGSRYGVPPYFSHGVSGIHAKDSCRFAGCHPVRFSDKTRFTFGVRAAGVAAKSKIGWGLPTSVYRPTISGTIRRVLFRVDRMYPHHDVWCQQHSDIRHTNHLAPLMSTSSAPHRPSSHLLVL